MAFTTFNVHDTANISAVAHSVNGTHWIDLSFGGGVRVGVFLPTQEIARDYAAAINSVAHLPGPVLEAAE